MKNTFKSTSVVGKFGENLVEQILRKANIPYIKINGKFTGYDLECLIGRIRFTIEVKFDRMESETGNIAIEYFNIKQGKSSGIEATQSDLWIFVLDNPITVWIANTKILKEYIINNPCDKHVKRGGDDNASIKLYKRNKIFKNIFYRIDNLSDTKLKDLILKVLN